MSAFHLEGVITEDHRLIAEVPTHLKPGDVELWAQIRERRGVEVNATLEKMRTMLASVGALSSTWSAPADARELTIDERIHLGRLAPGSRSTESLVDEERGKY